jgi:hypothetical protein
MTTNAGDSPSNERSSTVNASGAEAQNEIAPQSATRRDLPPAAQRALAEAAERRALRDRQLAAVQAEAELGGREGPDPVRYGDWENKGICSDF